MHRSKTSSCVATLQMFFGVFRKRSACCGRILKFYTVRWPIARYRKYRTVLSYFGDSPRCHSVSPCYHIFCCLLSFSSNTVLPDAYVCTCLSTGVFGECGRGLVSSLGLEQHPALLASMHSFGKALGVHGAVVVGSSVLRQFLINYARPLIYSTSLPLHRYVRCTLCKCGSAVS